MKNLLLSLSILHFFIFTVQAQYIKSTPLLTVTGEAIIKAIPDQAIISVRVQKKVDIVNISAVSDAFLFSKENADIKFIDETNKGIFSTIPEVDVTDKNAVFSKEFIITVYNLQDLPKIVMELLRHDFLNIYSIRYRLSTIDQVMKTARKEAVASALSRAMNLAAELGQSIGKAHFVKEENVPVNNWYVENHKPDMTELLGISYYFNPGYISVPCRVTVSFDLQ